MFIDSRILRENGRFSWPIIFTLVESMEWLASFAYLDTADLRSQACTDFRCSFSLVPSFLAVSSMYPASQFDTILVFDIVNDPIFPLNRDLIFWSYQVLTEGAMGFETNVNTTLFKDSLNNLGNPTIVREYNKFLSTGGRCLTTGLFWSRIWGSCSCNRPGWISAML